MKSALAIITFTVLPLLGFTAGAQAQECHAQRITIHANPGTGDINVTPPVLNAKKGCGLEINVPRDHTTAIISSAAGWLNASSGGETIYIDIPEDTANGDYKYDVDISGVGRLDPIVRVN